MTVRQLKYMLENQPEDMPVHVIFDGVIDEEPTWNVCEDRIYIKGVNPPCNS